MAAAVLPASPPASAAITPPEPVYRVRVAIRTTAPQAVLRLRGDADLIQARVASTTGTDRASWGGFGPGPFLVSGRAGARRAAATFVAALTPGDGGPVRFGLATRGRGATTIRLSNANSGTVSPLRTVRDLGPGRERFSVPVASVAAGGPVPGTEPLPPQALAFYYPWYEPSDWSGGKPIAPSNAIDTPYWSGDPAVIDRHITQARAAGLDGFVVSWWGREAPWDANTKALVERLPPGFTFALYVETFSPHFGTVTDLIEELDYALDTYAASDRYFRIDGRPVLYAFSTHNVLTPVEAPGKTPGYEEIWERVRAALATLGHHPLLIGEGRPFSVSDFDVFDGMHVYGTQDPAQTSRLDREMALTARAWAAVHGGSRRIWAASVVPGYDDRHIPGRKPDYFPRDDGRLYEEQWTAAIDSHSDQALVVSFNEWMETTNIEPNLEWGTRYLDLTAMLTDRFRQSRAP
ncbi:MAG TPA: hypothetical protein VHH92_01315 [Actinomycetota bacterium]|nr:hypothetical protein [Actinomycetota bacterium]